MQESTSKTADPLALLYVKRAPSFDVDNILTSPPPRQKIGEGVWYYPGMCIPTGEFICSDCGTVVNYCTWKKKVFFYCFQCKVRLGGCYFSKKDLKRRGIEISLYPVIPDDDRKIRHSQEWYYDMCCYIMPPEIEALRAMPYSEYLLTEHWQETRAQALHRGGYKCCACGSGTRLEVHHIQYDRLGFEAAEDLEVLCHRCHMAHHCRPETPLSRYPTLEPVKVEVKATVYSVG